jgi:Holliday junction resolvasome RuvABC endonuclease subunit
MKVVGIDPSLTSTGLAYREDGKVKAYCIGNAKLRGLPRVAFIRNAVASALDRFAPDVVAFEGYALGFRGKSNIIFDIGELGGVLKLLILERGIDILLVPPTSLKLFATGSGRPKGKGKEPVMLALEKRLGVKFSTSDQYDAAGLLVMGETYPRRNSKETLRGRSVPLAVHERKALNGCSLLASSV